MPRESSDRNLLFGILAVQMDFIARDALIVAMNAWVLEKAKPLAQILLEQKALTPDTRLLLDALVQKHLDLHGNDPQQSLAAVNSVGSVKKDLERIADVDVQASIAYVTTPHVSAGGGEAADPFATTGVGASTSAGQRFRILRPHAKGGLGEVFVAHDEELHREVALKEIQDRHADDQESRARFMLEAEITGGLEHPGIVPVYGLGQYADGRPFYAMRFIGVVLAKIQRGDFQRPSQINPEVDRALEAVCLKAMALTPADRYATPLKLADDVEKWLADESVSAWPEPLSRQCL